MSPKRGKTLKLVTKRLKMTKKGKVLRRTMQQGHGKSKESGNLTRLKRKLRDASEHPIIRKAIRKMYQAR